MTTRKVRRAVTASILVAASCNVYNPSLLVGHGGAGGSDSGASGGSGGVSGSSGGSAQAGTTTSAGKGTSGGASGTNAGGTSGRASGGSGGANGGTGNESTAGGEGGEAGAMGEGGTVSAGSGGNGGTTGGVSGGGGSAGTGASAGTGGSIAGAGGSAGTGAIAGMGGTAGASGGRAGAGGSAGAAAGMGGAGGAAPASGCANLTVPLVGGGDKAHFVITLTNAANMSASSTNIAMRVYVLAGSGGIFMPYVQDTGNHFMSSTTTRPVLSTLVGVWTTLTWNVGSETAVNGIDKTAIKRIGIEVTANNASPLTNPTRIYVDWVSTSVVTPVPSLPFDTSGTVDTTASNGVDVGGQVLWLSSASSDTSATGVTLGWLTSCP